MQVGDSLTRGNGCTVLDSWRLAVMQLGWAVNRFMTFVGPNTDTAGTSLTGNHYDAVPGDRIDQRIPTLDADLLLYEPNIVVVLLGTNNALQGAITTAAVTADFTTLLNTIRARMPLVDILVVLPIPLPGSAFIASVVSQETNVVNTFIAGGDTHIYLCDAFTQFTGPYADSVHPSCVGYGAGAGNLGQVVWTVLQTLPSMNVAPLP